MVHRSPNTLTMKPHRHQRILWLAAWGLTVAAAYWAGIRWTATDSSPAPTPTSVALTQGNPEAVSEGEIADETATSSEPPAAPPKKDKMADAAREVLALTPEEMPAALQCYLAQEDNWDEITMLANRWAQFDPQTAFEAGLPLKGTPQINAYMGGVFATWSRSDPRAAFAAYQEYLVGEPVYTATEEAFYGLTCVDPAQALGVLNAYSEDNDHIQYNRSNGIVQALVENYDLTLSMDILDQAENRDQTDELRFQVIYKWADYDFDRAAAYVMEHETSPDKHHMTTLDALIMGSLYPHRNRLLDWAGEQDRLNGNHEMVAFVIWKWSRDNPNAPRQWLSQLPDGETKQALYQATGIAPLHE